MTSVLATDVFMANCDGLDVIAALHRDSPSTCIVAVSGYESAGNIDFPQAAKSFGAASTLRKPFRGADLLNAVAACRPERN